MRAPSNLSPAAYAAAVQRNPTYGMLVPVGSSGGQSASPATATNSAPVSQGSGLSPTETAARNTLNQFANDPGSAGLKLQLAQDGVSLTDNSDVGPGRRFETFSDKLQFVMAKKVAYIIAIRLSMVGGSGWGPSKTEAVKEAKAELHGRAKEGERTKSDTPSEQPNVAPATK